MDEDKIKRLKKTNQIHDARDQRRPAAQPLVRGRRPGAKI